jgi:hypothetical protein
LIRDFRSFAAAGLLALQLGCGGGGNDLGSSGNNLPEGTRFPPASFARDDNPAGPPLDISVSDFLQMGSGNKWTYKSFDSNQRELGAPTVAARATGSTLLIEETGSPYSGASAVAGWLGMGGTHRWRAPKRGEQRDR